MKNKILTLCSVFILILLAGCNWQIPEKVSVKTQAEYNFAMGEYQKELETQFDVSKMSEQINIKDGKLYDYCPGFTLNSSKDKSKIQQFLLRVPLVEIPIDINSYFNSSSMGSSFENFSFNEVVSIPEVAFNFEETIDMGEVMKAINAGMTVLSPAVNGKMNFSIDFDRVEYSEGSMVIICPAMEDYTTVELSNGNKKKEATFYDYTASIDLEDFEFINNSMHISFSSPSSLKQFTATISENSKIKSASGITYVNPMDSNDKEIAVPITCSVTSISENADFNSCTIGEGTLISEIIFPSDWSGVGVSYGIRTTGGMNINSEKTEGCLKRVDLADTSLTTGKTNVEAKVYLTLTNATFTSESNPKFATSSEIVSFKEVSVTNNSIETSKTEHDKFSDSVLETIKSIRLGSSGLKGTYTNTFPEGNDIVIVADSTFFGMSGNSTTLKSNKTGEELSIKTAEDYDRTVVLSPTPSAGQFDEWDFSVNIRLPGYTPARPNDILVKNVRPGEEYEIALSIQPEINWKEVVINSKQIEQQDTRNLGFKLKSILDSFGNELGIDIADKIVMDSLPVYLYCTKPEMTGTNPFDNAKFFGSIAMYSGDSSGNVLNGSDGKPLKEVFVNQGNIEFVQEPQLTVETETEIVTTDISKFDSSCSKDIASFLGSTTADSEIWLDYNITFTNGKETGDIVITPDMLTEDSVGAIGVSAMIVFPLQFRIVNGDLVLDVKSIAKLKTEDDIFNRKEPTKIDDYKKYVDVIKSVGISYNAKALPVHSEPEAVISIDLKDGSAPRFKGMESDYIELSSSTFDYMLNTYPFNPDVTCTIKEDSIFTIPRYSALVMSLSVHLETDGVINLTGEK